MIVPWRNSLVTARMPSTSANTCAKPAIPSRSRSGVSLGCQVAVAAAMITISEHQAERAADDAVERARWSAA